MKNQIQNHHIEGIRLMSVIQGFVTKGYKTFLVMAVAMAAMLSSANCAVALDLTADSAASFDSALGTITHLTNLDENNTITLTGNVDYTASKDINIGDKKITINLEGFNLMGTQNFTVTGGSGSELTLVGNTVGFNLGFKVKGDIVLNYDGTYTSANNDVFGQAGDDVTINFDILNPNPYSTWNATGRKITIGETGTAKFNVGSGNHVLSRETVAGESTGGNGTINIYNQGTHWKNTENFVVGDVGTGTLYLGLKDDMKLDEYHGAVLETGNFIVGSETGGSGTVKITGTGTVLNIFGTSATNTGANGTAEMTVDERAEVYLNSTKGTAHLTLGAGDTLFDNAYFQIDRGYVNAVGNDIIFENNAMFEGTTWDRENHLNFSKITADSLTINDAVFSPGFGNKVYWDNGGTLDFSEAAMVDMYYTGKNAGDARYGYLDTNVLTLGSDSVSIFDFDIQGDTNHASGADIFEHKDYVLVNGGSATVDGHIHFRPMSGFYQDAVTIDFMSAASGTFSEITIWPQRWFENVDVAANSGTLTMTRHQTPFHSSGIHFNEQSVGTALDVIYNTRQNTQVGNVLADQKQDEWFPVLDWVWGMGDYDFRMAMRQLAGEARVSSFYMPIRSPWRFGFDRTNWRKCDNHVYFGQQNVNTAVTSKSSLWVTPYYDYLHMSEDDNINGANISRVSFMAGYDRALSRYSAAGFLFGYSQPKMDQGSSRVVADDYLFALHGATRIFDDYELKLWGSYGTQNYRLSRHVPINGGESVHANYSGNSWTGSVQLARPINHKKGVIRPLVAIDYSYVEQNDATETGYHPIALHYEDSDWSQLFARAGIRADYGWSRFNFTGSVSYSYQFAGDVTPTCTNRFVIDGPSFDIQGNNLSRSFVNIGLGTQLYLNKRQSRMLFVQYNGVYGDNMNSQNASLGYQMTF